MACDGKGTDITDLYGVAHENLGYINIITMVIWCNMYCDFFDILGMKHVF